LRSAIRRSISSLGPSVLLGILPFSESLIPEAEERREKLHAESRIRTDNAFSRSVILAKRAWWDLKRKCCSLVLKGRDRGCVGGIRIASSSDISALLEIEREDPEEGKRRPNVGVISGVGRPA
jgi:hypothetical protein